MADPAAKILSPVIAEIVRQRTLTMVMAAVGVVQVISTLLGMTLYPCPFLHATGVPCPGCGASRACAALLRGRFRDAFRLHLFAPFFLLAIAIFIFASFLSESARLRFTQRLADFENATKITQLLLAAAIVYWLFRLLYDFHGFQKLIWAQ
jgi:hypothetical protein